MGLCFQLCFEATCQLLHSSMIDLALQILALREEEEGGGEGREVGWREFG